MFILTTIRDVVQIVPVDFEKDSAEVIEDNLNAKYSNRIIPNVGLGICVYDIDTLPEGRIGHDAAFVNVNVDFRLLVFRPFKGEIILGRISSASELGMKVRLDFFDDIHVPPNMLFPGSYFNVKEQCWVWRNEGSDFYFDKHDWVRVRIEQEHWHDTSPVAPMTDEQLASSDRKSPYSITASMMHSGLGNVIWWE